MYLRGNLAASVCYIVDWNNGGQRVPYIGQHQWEGTSLICEETAPVTPVYLAPQIPSPTVPDGVIRTSPMPPKVIDPAAPSAPAPSALPPKITTIPPVNSNPAPSGGAMPFDDVMPGDASPRQLEPAAAPASGVPWLLLASIAVAAMG